jgi:4-hydroxy-tetrahydrodipicolinate synthase
MTLQGAMVAIVTPFKNGAFDEDAFRALCDWQIREGTDVLVPCGTTGESATLSAEEQVRVIRAAVEVARGRVPVVAGTGTNDTRTTIEKTRKAKELGADGVLLVTPYYNKPTQEGLFLHYQAVLKEVPIDAVLYNVPGRTGVSLAPETVARLTQIPGVKAIKEATGDMNVASQIFERCGDRIALLSGDDFTFFPLLALGGKGVISVVSNAAPRLVANLWDAWAAGRVEEARRLHYQMMPLTRALFLETNPIPVKWAVHRLGKIADEIRLPLTVLSAANREKVERAMRESGVL